MGKASSYHASYLNRTCSYGQDFLFMNNAGHAIRGRGMHKPITKVHGFRSSTLLKEGIERKERERIRGRAKSDIEEISNPCVQNP